MYIAVDRMKDFATALLLAGGFLPMEAKAMAASLTLSEMMGHPSHGLIRIKSYIAELARGEFASGAQIDVIQETPTSLTADAKFAVGHTTMPLLLDKMYAKLETQAVVTAGVRDCGHIGRLGEWVEHAALMGYAALLMVNDNGGYLNVAPPGGKQAVASTNPIAFAVPSADGHIFLTDMSTSAVAFGKVKVSHMNGTAMPPGVIQDAEGRPTTDPAALFADPGGTLLPMGGAQGYKGFALSMFVDILVAGLSGGQTPPVSEGALYANNLVLVLWNPKFFAGLEHMQQQAEKYIAFVRASAPTDPAKPIRLPGDRMNTFRKEHEKRGVPVNAELAQYLVQLAERLNVEALSELKAAA